SAAAIVPKHQRCRSGPTVNELIVKAVSASKERNGVSLAALKKDLAAGGYDVDKNKARLKMAVRSLVSKGTLVQTKGTGAISATGAPAPTLCTRPTGNCSPAREERVFALALALPPVLPRPLIFNAYSKDFKI
uniref:H15 domain-containing protein n=1 Tax=Takifugu rubripes TaxID=31033 RepID=H2S5I0_TAKRU